MQQITFGQSIGFSLKNERDINKILHKVRLQFGCEFEKNLEKYDVHKHYSTVSNNKDYMCMLQPMGQRMHMYLHDKSCIFIYKYKNTTKVVYTYLNIDSSFFDSLFEGCLVRHTDKKTYTFNIFHVWGYKGKYMHDILLHERLSIIQQFVNAHMYDANIDPFKFIDVPYCSLAKLGPWKLIPDTAYAIVFVPVKNNDNKRLMHILYKRYTSIPTNIITKCDNSDDTLHTSHDTITTETANIQSYFKVSKTELPDVYELIPMDSAYASDTPIIAGVPTMKASMKLRELSADEQHPAWMFEYVETFKRWIPVT